MSVGQVVDAPSHTSETSHRVAAGRQTVPALPAGCVHVPCWQISCVHGLSSVEQSGALALKPSVGHFEVVPSHASASSHSPTATRQTTPGLPGACAQTPI